MQTNDYSMLKHRHFTKMLKLSSCAQTNYTNIHAQTSTHAHLHARIYLNLAPARLDRYISHVCNGPVCRLASHRAL